jgi:pimeloyl-ACP methyl ester carboxylesterase
MQDPDLRERLGAVTIPALAAWGESDRIVTPDYGRAYASAFPKGRFEPIAASGHMPQLEQPQRFLDLVLAFERGV